MGALLIVDDDHHTLTAYTALFAAQEPATKVLTATSAEEAVDLIQTLIFDAVLCDLRLPGTDGLSLMKRCQGIQSETPFILVTSYGDRDLEERRQTRRLRRPAQTRRSHRPSLRSEAFHPSQARPPGPGIDCPCGIQRGRVP